MSRRTVPDGRWSPHEIPPTAARAVCTGRAAVSVLPSVPPATGRRRRRDVLGPRHHFPPLSHPTCCRGAWVSGTALVGVRAGNHVRLNTNGTVAVSPVGWRRRARRCPAPRHDWHS